MPTTETIETFEAMYGRQFESVRAYCLRRLPPADANEVVADVFVVAWQRFEDRPAVERERPWLYAIARYKIAHAKRSFSRRSRLNRKVQTQHPGFESGPELDAVESEMRREMLAELERLTPNEREVIQLSIWEELTAAEIAEVIGVSVAAAEKRLARARRRLMAAARQNSKLAEAMTGGER